MITLNEDAAKQTEDYWYIAAFCQRKLNGRTRLTRHLATVKLK